MPIPRILVIGGSDSGAGAGIQADLKTIMALGGYATTVVTALTAQDTRRVRAACFTPPDLIRHQFRMVFDDIGADVVKIGMLGEAPVVKAVARMSVISVPRMWPPFSSTAFGPSASRW